MDHTTIGTTEDTLRGDVTAHDSGPAFVTAAHGDRVRLLMAEPDQCRALGLPLWSAKLVWSITHQDGTTTLYPADDVQVLA